MLSSATTKYVKKQQTVLTIVWGFIIMGDLINLFVCNSMVEYAVERGELPSRDVFFIMPRYFFALLWVLVVFYICKRIDSTKFLKKIYQKANFSEGFIAALKNNIKLAMPTAAVEEITEREVRIIEVLRRYTPFLIICYGLAGLISSVGFVLSVTVLKSVGSALLLTVFSILLLWMMRPQPVQLLDRIGREVVEL